MDVNVLPSSLNSEDSRFYDQFSLGLLVNSWGYGYFIFFSYGYSLGRGKFVLGIFFFCIGHSFLMLGVYTEYWAFSIHTVHFFLLLGVYT